MTILFEDGKDSKGYKSLYKTTKLLSNVPKKKIDYKVFLKNAARFHRAVNEDLIVK